MRTLFLPPLALLVAACGMPEAVGQLPEETDMARSAPSPSPDLREEEPTPDVGPDGGAPAVIDMASPSNVIVPGGTARVTAGSLNLRTGPSTMFQIITAMPCASAVKVVGGPMNGWWNVTYENQTGWASGNYLVADGAFDPGVCAGAPPGDAGVGDGGLLNTDQASILARCKLGVGYSYYWGHGSWRQDGADRGACMGSCPNCSHMGKYGADCSGYVAKCWQIPTASALETDLHPYSTYNFYNQTTHWTQVPRAQIKPADSLVYNANGSGHMVLFDTAMDPWGNLWLYEARGCSYGIVRNLRALPGQFITIRRNGL